MVRRGFSLYNANMNKKKKEAEDKHAALARELNKETVGGGRRLNTGAVFWAALCASDGKTVPIPPEGAETDPPVVRSAAELEKAARKLRR